MNFGPPLEEGSLSSGDLEGDCCLELEDLSSSRYAKYPYFAAITDIINDGKPTTDDISLPFPFNVVNNLLKGKPTISSSSAFFANEYTQSPQLYKGLLKVPDGIGCSESWSNQYHNTILFGLLALEDNYSVEAINCWGNKQQLIESCILPNYLLNIGAGGGFGICVNNTNGQNQQQPSPPPLPIDVQFTSNDTVRILHSMLPMLKKKQCPLYHVACGISDSNSSNVLRNNFSIENNKDISEEYFMVGQIIKMIIFERIPLPFTNDQLIEHHFTKHLSLTSLIVMFACSLRVGFGGADNSSFTTPETIETIATFALIQCNPANAPMELAPLSLGIISTYSTECSGHSARSLLKRIIDGDGHSCCVKFSAAKGYAFSLLLSDCTHLFDLSTTSTTTLEGLLAYVMINERPSENGCNFYLKQRSLEERILHFLIDDETAAPNRPALAFIRDSFRIFSTTKDDAGDWSCCVDLLKNCCIKSNTATNATFDSKIKDQENHCLRWFLLLGMAIRLHVNPSLVELESFLIREIGPLTMAFSASFKGFSGHIRALIMALLTSRTPETPVEPKIRWAILISCIFPFEQLSSPICSSSSSLSKSADTSSINWSMIMFNFVVEKKKRKSSIKISPKVKNALFDSLKNLTGLTGELLEYLVEE